MLMKLHDIGPSPRPSVSVEIKWSSSQFFKSIASFTKRVINSRSVQWMRRSQSNRSGFYSCFIVPPAGLIKFAFKLMAIYH